MLDLCCDSAWLSKFNEQRPFLLPTDSGMEPGLPWPTAGRAGEAPRASRSPLQSRSCGFCSGGSCPPHRGPRSPGEAMAPWRGGWTLHAGESSWEEEGGPSQLSSLSSASGPGGGHLCYFRPSPGVTRWSRDKRPSRAQLLPIQRTRSYKVMRILGTKVWG